MKAIDLIKNSLTEQKVRDLLSMLGAKGIEKYGDGIRCTCPIHLGDNKTAFVWDLSKGLWFCHTNHCGGGDVFDLISKKYDIDIDENFKYLIRTTAEMLGISLVGVELGERLERHVKETRDFVNFMLNKQNKRENEPFNIRKLGTLYEINEFDGFDKELLKDYEVFYIKEYNRVAFSIKDENNETIGAVLRRCNEEDNPKWLNRPKNVYTGSVLYNLNNIKGKYTSVYIVEGIRDALQLIKIGIENVVCTFGSKITDEQVKLLMKYFLEITIMFDNDKAGIIGTHKALEKTKKKFDVTIADFSELSINDPGQIENIEIFKQIKMLKVYEWEEKYNDYIKSNI